MEDVAPHFEKWWDEEHSELQLVNPRSVARAAWNASRNAPMLTTGGLPPKLRLLNALEKLYAEATALTGGDSFSGKPRHHLAEAISTLKEQLAADPGLG